MMRLRTQRTDVEERLDAVRHRRSALPLCLMTAVLTFHLLGTGSASAQSALQITIESPPFVLDGAPYNPLSERGFPLSTTPGVPSGSDGRAPTVDEQFAADLTVNPPTSKQFQGMTIYGLATEFPGFNGSTIPQNPDGTIRMTVVEIGAPIVARQVSFLFGSPIPVPSTNEDDEILVGAPGDYWFAEPHDSGNADNRYYFSKHATEVFAVNAGTVEVVWKKKESTQIKPGDFDANPEKYSLEGGNYFTLFTKLYLVSGSAAKSPQKIYWTEGGFTGPPVTIPTAKVGDIHIVYTEAVPEEISEEEALANHRNNPPIPFRSTLTLDRQSALIQLKAFNREGRVFIELLGDPLHLGDRRVHLGYKIVDIFKEAVPAELQIELGERITAYQDSREDSHLNPEPLNQGVGGGFYFQHFGAGREILYAVRETVNLNDLLIHWLRAGEQGIEWPFRFTRYELDWPVEEIKFSHYLRPLVVNKAEAEKTAVALPSQYSTEIAYQDPVPNPLGAYVTADIRFYTFLNSGFPRHRTLLKYTVENEVGFERVFSRLISLREVVPVAFNDGPVPAGNFDDLNPANKGSAAATEVRFVYQSVEVGQRIEAPAGEAGSVAGADYLAGYLNTEIGASFNPAVYTDPFVVGFETADQGAIIPVNAIPGDNRLEVWWFRASNLGAAKGFRTVFWPSVIARYSIVWPAESREIILASDDGSGPLQSLEAKGSIYFQNDSSQFGYNPNEEHALMAGGQAFALRDDLNLIAGSNYSSEAYVLVDHLASDSRPDMAIFKVLREKPADDITFTFTREVPLVLQAPMPLPLMDMIVRGNGITDVNNLSEELSVDVDPNWLGVVTSSEYQAGGTTSLLLTLDTDQNAPLARYSDYVLVNPNDPTQQYWYFLFNENVAGGKIEGLLSQRRPYLLVGDAQTVGTAIFAGSRSLDFELDQVVAFMRRATEGVPAVDLAFGISAFDDDRREITLNRDRGVADWPRLTLLDRSRVFDDLIGWRLYAADTPVLAFTATVGTSFVYQDRKATLWMYRGRHNDTDLSGFAMRYYYKTQPGFFLPSFAAQPEVGTIVPYLRTLDPVNGNWIGNALQNEGQALPIIYKPIWPLNPAEMPLAYSLTEPAFGLPAVRGQTSLEVLYQQSEHQAGPEPSVLLHDPTREKQYFMGDAALAEIPPSVRTQNFRGFTYFPNLPPHLSDRFFFDPNRGALGALVFRGEFMDEALGEDYLLLNVLTPTDLETVKALSIDSPVIKGNWDNAIDALTTTLETFREDPDVPGTFIVDTSLDKSVGIAQIAKIISAETAVDSYALTAIGPGAGFVTLIFGNGAAFTPQEEPVSMNVFRVLTDLHRGEIKIVQSSNPLAEQLTLQQVVDLAGKADEYIFEWLIAQPVDGLPPTVPTGDDTSGWILITDADGTRVTIGGKPDIRSLTDNFLIVRYGPRDPADSAVTTSWSAWTMPQLAEGWIKRVLGGINPFNQRVTNLFNNTVNTSASILTQAGPRWEGDVALNLDTIDDSGLIAIYETILRRDRGLSIDADIDFGPANDALLLAAGYLNDLYMIVGNEALADAANPTIGISTKDSTFREVATAMFSFKGQLATLLDEELALLRGRDDFLQPGVEITPVYNRLIWNFTRGIDSGEVIYANNYNIQENQEGDLDGVINAADAQKMYPQGHGDAYGHYLTALTGYYHLLIDADFTWIPRTESVTILGKPVQVDYLDERKFAAAAGAVARTGKQVFDLTWRKDFKSGKATGWKHFSEERENTRPELPTTRYWGLDHWATRTGQGAYLNWVVGNSILPEIDPDPDHEGIQKIDRTTVPELDELTSVLSELQISMDNAEAHLNPLGLSENSIAFDINPGGGTPFATGTSSHFEQIFERATKALNNAVVAFDDAKDITQVMRSEQDSLTGFQAGLDSQELAFKNSLIELYGTPYPDDIGPGRTYATGYDGPDLDHFMYVDLVALDTGGDPEAGTTLQIDIQPFPGDWLTTNPNTRFDFIVKAHRTADGKTYTKGRDFVEFTLDSHGFFMKPATWNSRRASPGSVQRSISSIIIARNNALSALKIARAEKYKLDRMIDVFEAYVDTQDHKRDIQRGLLGARSALEFAKFANEMFQLGSDLNKDTATKQLESLKESLPRVLIFGLASGGDLTSAARGALETAENAVDTAFDIFTFARKFAFGAYEVGLNEAERIQTFEVIDKEALTQSEREKVFDLDMQLDTVQGKIRAINGGMQSLDDERCQYQALTAKGTRIQLERGNCPKTRGCRGAGFPHSRCGAADFPQ